MQTGGLAAAPACAGAAGRSRARRSRAAALPALPDAVGVDIAGAVGGRQQVAAGLDAVGAAPIIARGRVAGRAARRRPSHRHHLHLAGDRLPRRFAAATSREQSSRVLRWSASTRLPPPASSCHRSACRPPHARARRLLGGGQRAGERRVGVAVDQHRSPGASRVTGSSAASIRAVWEVFEPTSSARAVIRAPSRPTASGRGGRRSEPPSPGPESTGSAP